jgi:hypothetical protein
MKPLHFILSLLIGFMIAVITFDLNLNDDKPKIDLPEEYKMIDKSTAIQGYFDKDSILHIEFDNSIQFKWEGLEKDIPSDGNQMLNLSTNENTIYLNPVDE